MTMIMKTSKCVYVESEMAKRKKRMQIKAWRAERVKEYAKIIQQGKRIFEPDKD